MYTALGKITHASLLLFGAVVHLKGLGFRV